MIKVLEIGTQALDQKDVSRRNLQKERRIACARLLMSYDLILFIENRGKGLKITREADNLVVYEIGGSKLFAALTVVKVAMTIIKKKKIDVVSVTDVFVFGLIGLLIKKMYHIPLNTQVHFDYFSEYFWAWQSRPNWIKKTYKLIAKVVYKGSNSIRVVSVKTKNDIQALGPEKKIIEVIPTPVEFNFSNLSKSGASAFEKYRANRNEKMLLYVGRLIEAQKGLTTLFKAFHVVANHYENVKLLVLGCGCDENFYRKMTVELGINNKVVFFGSIAHEDVFSYYKTCDLFVISSKFEGRSTVLAEAGLCGMPIVATRFTGTQDLVVHGKTGYVVDIGDHEDFAEKILQLLRDPAKMREFGKCSQEHVLNVLEQANGISCLVELWEKTAIKS